MRDNVFCIFGHLSLLSCGLPDLSPKEVQKGRGSYGMFKRLGSPSVADRELRF